MGYIPNRGFLFGPICPIYGYGAIILISFLYKYKDNLVKLFFSSAIILSLFEYVVSYALDVLFKVKWWDYTNDFLNLNGRISIFYTFAWGIIAIVFIKILNPLAEKLVEKVTMKLTYIANRTSIILFVIVYVTDTVLSFIYYYVVN